MVAEAGRHRAVVDRKLSYSQWVSAAGGDVGGTLYLAGVDARLGVWLGRSVDGGRHFSVRQAAPLPQNDAANCLRSGKYVFAQQAIRCLGPNPTVTVGRGRTYVTYASLSPNQTWDVGIAVFDAKLRLLWRGRIGPAETKPRTSSGPPRPSMRQPASSGPALRHDGRPGAASRHGFCSRSRTAGTGAAAGSRRAAMGGRIRALGGCDPGRLR